MRARRVECDGGWMLVSTFTINHLTNTQESSTQGHPLITLIHAFLLRAFTHTEEVILRLFWRWF
jgi:hypothetical protein